MFLWERYEFCDILPIQEGWTYYWHSWKKYEPLDSICDRGPNLWMLFLIEVNLSFYYYILMTFFSKRGRESPWSVQEGIDCCIRYEVSRLDVLPLGIGNMEEAKIYFSWSRKIFIMILQIFWIMEFNSMPTPIVMNLKKLRDSESDVVDLVKNSRAIYWFLNTNNYLWFI